MTPRPPMVYLLYVMGFCSIAQSPNIFNGIHFREKTECILLSLTLLIDAFRLTGTRAWKTYCQSYVSYKVCHGWKARLHDPELEMSAMVSGFESALGNYSLRAV